MVYNIILAWRSKRPLVAVACTRMGVESKKKINLVCMERVS